MLSDFASLANGPLKQYPLRRQTLTQGFLEHGIEVTTSGHLNPYSLGGTSRWRCDNNATQASIF